MIRSEIGFDMPILVPGVGSQGGDLKKVLEMGTDVKGGNILINVSRGIMFAYKKDEFEGYEMGEASRASARTYADSIRRELEDMGKW
jgi:orotidine-5'-phosphate decarboxylase